MLVGLGFRSSHVLARSLHIRGLASHFMPTGITLCNIFQKDSSDRMNILYRQSGFELSHLYDTAFTPSNCTDPAIMLLMVMGHRIQEELIVTYKDAEKRNSSAEIFDAVDQVRRLLLL